MSSFGAPIFNYNGDVIASIRLSSITQRLPLEKETEIGQLVISAANKISNLLGSR